MPIIDLSPDTINALFQNKHISPEVYNSLLAQNAPDQTPQIPQFSTFDPPGGMQSSPNDIYGVYPPASNTPPIHQAQIPNEMELKRQFAKKAGLSDDMINQRLGTPSMPAPNPDFNQNVKLASDLSDPNQPKPTFDLMQQMSQAKTPYDDAFNQQKNGVQDIADAQGKAANAQSGILEKGIQDFQGNEANRQINEDDRQMQMRDRISELDGATNQIAQMQIEPHKFWNDLSTAGKVATGISLFLGSFGSTPDNKVAGMLINAVNKNIALQKYQIANSRDNLAAKGTILSQMRTIFGDERQAEEATRIALLERIKLQTAQKAMQYTSPQVQANAQKLMGEIEAKKQEARQNFIESANNPFGINKGLTPSDVFQRDKDIRERTVPGLGVVDDGRESQKIRDMKAVTDPLRKNLTEMMTIVKDNGRSILPFKEVTTRAKSLATETKLQLKELENLGVLNGPDMEILSQLIPGDPTAIFTVNTDTKLDQALKMIEDRWDFYVKARGLKDVTIDEARKAREPKEKSK